MPLWKDSMSRTRCSGTPTLERTDHRAARGMESYALRRSMYTRNALVRCSWHFSMNWRTTKAISEHDRPLRKPHCSSGSTSSASSCRRPRIILAQSFPTTSSNATPRQLSPLVTSPFLGMGTISASTQSLGTAPLAHTSLIRSWT